MGERSTACGLPGEPGSRQVLVTHRFLPLSAGEFPGWMLPSVSGHSLLQALRHGPTHMPTVIPGTPLPSNSEPLSSGNLLAPAGRLPFLGFGHIPVGYLVTLLAGSVHILTLLSGFLLFSLLSAL